jgi:hypothetical protein
MHVGVDRDGLRALERLKTNANIEQAPIAIGRISNTEGNAEVRARMKAEVKDRIK